ncbi:MAG: phosphomannomutase/phosphoglucomutase [Candidatus Neomarinimicrobiota bacterium]|nr:phosphomannomutase/phosphoglucomutase [Candidatus Neomarinimicrobiota bacterium]
MKVNRYVFRQYDVRGVVAEDFPSEFVTGLGRAFGTFVKRAGVREISISGDVRLTTPELKKQFKNGVLKTGTDVIDIGTLPTPANYYSMWKLEVGAAVQITGSHNPAEMNGFKMSLNKSAVYGDQIQQLRALMESEDFESGDGTEVKYCILDEYIEMIQSKIKLERTMKLAMDCGNASACLAAPKVFSGLGAEMTELFCDVDGRFPNHHPDPTVLENVNQLITTLKGGDFDAGLAYDGDADRIGLIDETGNIVFADQIMALMLPEIIQENEEVLFDVKCSQALEEEILRLGGRPVIWKTGHSLIKQRMKELGCKFGGEMSGHLFFADDYFGYDDAIYVSARVVQMLSRQEKKLSELVSALPQYYSTPEMRLECSDDEEKFRINDEATAFFKQKYDCLDIDGVRIRFPDGWGLVRASNTQPVIVCRFEAKSEERMKEIQQMILSKIGELGEVDVPDVV